MPKIPYIYKTFHGASLALIIKANEIIFEYQQQGFDLTLRQLYYQFVARGLIPNTQKSYKRLGNLINNGRLAGLIDWDSIVDRTRNLSSVSHWAEPSSIIESASKSYRVDKWADQAYRIEVWIEKEALAGVLENTCPPLDIPYFPCRGYVSQSEQWRAAQRLRWYEMRGQRTYIIHLGDHDPSGIDMTRDITERLYMFGCHPTVDRIALNMDQIDEYQPPPNPAKTTDSRYRDYVQRYGENSWELDALEPQTIAKLITDKVLELRDHKKWGKAVKRETKGRKVLSDIAERYDDVVTFLKEKDPDG